MALSLVFDVACSQYTKPNAPAITANVNNPIRTYFARSSIDATPLLALYSHMPVRVGTGTMDIRRQPRVLRCQHLFHSARFDNLAFAQHRNAVADPVQAVEIVCHHEHRDAER